MRVKRPRFDFNADLRTDVFDVRFDFILAQSIFSHAGPDFVGTALTNFRESLQPYGLVAATFCEGPQDFAGTGWVYPGFVEYRPSTVQSFARSAGLSVTRIPWYHPGQVWYVFARDKKRLPGPFARRLLNGAILDRDFAASWRILWRMATSARKHARLVVPAPVKKFLRRIVGVVWTTTGDTPPE
jgi:hypothetical protein